MTREQALTLIAKALMEGRSISYHTIAIKLMERDPIMFVEMAELAGVSEPWLREAREAFNKGEAMPCIKAIRAGKAIGLWEAKQVYVAWRDGSWMCDDYRVTNEMIDILVTLRG